MKSVLFISELMSYSHRIIIYCSEADWEAIALERVRTWQQKVLLCSFNFPEDCQDGWTGKWGRKKERTEGREKLMRTSIEEIVAPWCQ